MRLSRNVRGIINLYTGTLLSGMGFSMVLPIMAILGEEFGVATGTVAQIVTAYALGRTAGIPVAGIFADRLGTRVSLIAGPVLVLGGAAIGVVTPWLWPIFAAMFIAGAGDSLWAMGREIAGIDLVRSDQRGRVMSGFHGLHAAGMALGPLLGGVLADVINFRAVFVAFVIIAAAAVALGTFAHNAHASRAPAASGIGKKGGIVERVKGIGELVKEIEPGLRLSYAVFVFATIGGFVFRITVQSMLPLFAGSQLGFTATQVGILFSISGIIITAMILPAGFLLDKLGRKWATVPSMLLPGIAFLLIPFSETFLQLTVLIAVVGVSNGLSLGSLATSTYDVVPVHARGRLQALRRSVAEIGGVGAPLFGGVLANPTIQACRSCCTRPYCCWPDSCWRSWRRRRWSRSPQTRT